MSKSFALTILLFFLILALMLNSVSAIDFKFTGFVQNTSYVNLSGVNVTISRFSEGTGGAPGFTAINNTQTGSAGNFTMVVSDPAGNAGTGYRLKAIQYNISADNVNVTAVAMSPDFPEVPSVVFTSAFDNGTIFIQPAAVINITAFTNDSSLNRTNLSGIVLDDALGMPLEGAWFENVFQKSIVVPSNRNYTVVVMGGGYTTPPIGYRVLSSNLTDSTHHTGFNTFDLKANLTISLQTVNGTFSVHGNRTPVNVSDILLYSSIGKLVPLMAPPINFRTATPSKLGFFGYNLYESNNKTYNASLVASQTGVTYLLAAFGKNGSNGAPGTAYYAGFQNLTLVTGTDITALNVTLYELAGNYSTSSFPGEISTSKTTISVRDNSSATAGPDHMGGGGFGEIVVTYQNEFGDVPIRMITDISGNEGGKRVPLLWVNKTSNIQNNVTVQIYNSRFSPLRTKLNLSNANITLNLKTFSMERQSAGKPNFEHFSSSDKAATNMMFIKNQASCNVFNAENISTCKIGGDLSGSTFNPLQMAVAGKTNVFISLNTGVKLHFIGVDLLASGPPDAIISDTPNQDVTSGEARNQIFRFGSLAPDIYDRVLIGIPYDENKVNESDYINITFDTLLDENQNLLWNGSQFPNGTSIPSRYSDYPANITNTTAGGLRCYNVTSATCYINTTMNMMWLDLPHFDGGDIKLQGDDSAPPGGSGGGNVPGSGAGSGGGGGGGAAASTATGIKYSRAWPSLEPGAATVEVKKEGIGVTEIIVNVRNPVKDVQITVTKLDKAPADVSTPADSKVYQYIEIEKFNFKEADLGSSTLAFKVTKAWLTDNNVDEDSVVLLRLVAKAWTELSTKKLGSDNLAVSYTAETPGFSTFAIASKAIAAAPAVNETAEVPAAQPAQVKPVEAGRQLPAIFSNVYFWLVIAVILAVIAFFAFQQKGKKSQRR